MADLIKPKEISIEDIDGVSRKFVLSRFEAVQGREIVSKYLSSNLPKVGDYQVSEDVMLKLMGYIAVDVGGTLVRLTTQALINNHCGDWETTTKLEWAMIEYNSSFLQQGRIYSLLQGFATTFLQKISEMSTLSSAPSSEQTKPPSGN
jgi:hypothetical protein